MEKPTKIIFGILVLFLVFVWAEVAKSPTDNNVHIYFFDIGQGDAALIQKGNYQILIDGGPSDSVLSQLGKVMSLSDRTIEVIILTHPHSDHVTGLNQVMERYTVSKVYSTGVVHTSYEYLEFLENINNKNIDYQIVDIGYEIEPYANARLQFLWPGKRYQEREVSNLNNSSITNKFCYFNKCALFTGDIETDGQVMMFGEIDKLEINIESEILKVAHHGSSNGTDETMLMKVNPKYAVISAGADNQFGHPHKSIVDLILNGSIQLYRTDRDGTVEFVLGEESIGID